MLTCSLRDKSSHTQPMTPVSINMLPVCLGNDYSGFQLKHWLSILGPVHTNPDIFETVYLFSPVFMWTGLRTTVKRGFTKMGFRWASSLFSRGRKADPGEGPGRPAPPPPLFVDQIEPWRAKKQFLETGPPLTSGAGWPLPPPPAPLSWIHHCNVHFCCLLLNFIAFKRPFNSQHWLKWLKSG